MTMLFVLFFIFVSFQAVNFVSVLLKSNILVSFFGFCFVFGGFSPFFPFFFLFLSFHAHTV